MGKDGTQLLRHCLRLLVRVSTNLLAVRLSGSYLFLSLIYGSLCMWVSLFTYVLYLSILLLREK